MGGLAIGYLVTYPSHPYRARVLVISRGYEAMVKYHKHQYRQKKADRTKVLSA